LFVLSLFLLLTACALWSPGQARADSHDCTGNPTLVFDRPTVTFHTFHSIQFYDIKLSCKPSGPVTVDVRSPDESLGFYFEQNFVAKWEWDPTNRQRDAGHANPRVKNYQFTIQPDDWNAPHGVMLGNRHGFSGRAMCDGKRYTYQKDWGDDVALVNQIKLPDATRFSVANAGPTLTYTEPTRCVEPDLSLGPSLRFRSWAVNEGETIKIQFLRYHKSTRALPQNLFYYTLLYVKGKPLSGDDAATREQFATSLPTAGRFIIPKDSLTSWSNAGDDRTQSFVLSIPTVCLPGDQGTRNAILVMRDRNRHMSFVSNHGQGLEHDHVRLTINDVTGAGSDCPKAQGGEPILYTSARISGAAVGKVTPSTIRVGWDASAGVTGYEVQFRRSGDTGDWFRAVSFGPSIVLYGLQSQTTYDIQVYPIVLGMTGGFLASPTLRATTNAAPLPRLSDVSIGKRTHESIALSWPAIDGAESYQVRYWMEDKKSKTSKKLTVTSASATLENLKANRRYIIRVGYFMDGELVSGKVSEQIKAKTRKVPADSE